MKFLWHIRVHAKDFPYTTYRIFRLENNSYLADPLAREGCTIPLSKLYLQKSNGSWQATSEQSFDNEEVIVKLCKRIETYCSCVQKSH